jgi:hypothetical protein
MLLLSLTAAACAPAGTLPTAAAAPAASSTVGALPQQAAEPLTPTIGPPSAPTATVFVGPGGQFATDPSTVQLASGRPSLVKFFAFW